MIFVKCNSHRARSNVRRHLQDQTCYYSFERDAKGGIFKVTQAELDDIRARGVKGVTKVKAPYDDIRQCWTAN